MTCRNCLCALALLAPTAIPATAATLVESMAGEEAVTVLSDPALGRVRIAGAGGVKLIDLKSRTVYLTAPGIQAQKVVIDSLPPAPPTPAGTVVENIGRGPRVAGYPTTRFRLRVGAIKCSVIDANLGLATVLAPAMAAFQLLDRLNAALKGDSRAPCERIPYRRYKRIGWGLRVQDSDSPAIETIAVVKEYEPGSQDLALPADAQDVTAIVVNGTATGGAGPTGTPGRN
ncbi:MAG: hypothetical protein QF827_10375 [Alphaproteobacteria bacterium]|nr:hypothetical protein [Alphaproteobacteria bacterium]